MSNKPYILATHEPFEIMRSVFEEKYNMIYVSDVSNGKVDKQIIEIIKVLLIMSIKNCPKLDDVFFKSFPSIKCVVAIMIGYDCIDVDDLHKRGIVVGRGFGTYNTVADHTMAMLLASARMIIQGDKECHTTTQPKYDWMRYVNNAMQVSGSTVGLVGFGEIGQAIAKRCNGFDMNVLYYCRHRRSEEIEKLYNCKYCEKLDDLLKESDYVILILPSNKESYHIIGERELNIMKKSSMLINVARGAVLDQTALYNALKSKRIQYAALDVYEKEPLPLDDPLLALDNVLTSPHNGGSSKDAFLVLANNAVRNIDSYLESGIVVKEAE